jgi:asparagine synthase (glutamine-hydrolysing)
MCGICGELLFDGTAGPAGDFDQLSAMMARRGPDDAGYWADGPCQLAFRRLAIIDLSPAAHQPMILGRYALLFNGEVYNFRELRADLEREGVAFRSSGDTEVVAQALIHWGRAALDRLNGMFALAFYDAEHRRLLLARDAVGIKPLYVLLDRRGLFFASQYDQLLAHPWGERLAVDPEALGLYLRLGYVPAPYAIMTGTTMLMPGEWLEATAGGDVRRGRYYQFPVYQEPDLRGDEAYEAVDAAVAAAVRRQLVSDVPLGAFLSGGIDSPLVAAKAAATLNRPLQAFTIGSDDPTLDESADARVFAERLGLNHVVEQYTPARALDWLERVVEACGEPMADYSIFPTMLVSELARREVTVALSGDGGDELFWGYAARFGAVMNRAEAFRRPHWWRTGQRAAHRLVGANGASNGASAPPQATIGDWYRGVHSRLSDAALAEVFGAVPAWPAGYDLFDYHGWRAGETAQWLRWNEVNGHLTRVLLKVDRASMYHSLEVRVPLLDREVIDVAARVDWRDCLAPAEQLGKLPLRRALAGHVDFQRRAKRGFSVPMADWLRGPLLPLLRDTVLARPDLLGLPVNHPALAKIIDDHAAGRADRSRWLWSVLSLALWDERHLRRRAARERVVA